MRAKLSKLKLKRLLLCKMQKEVAIAMDISQTYLAQLENGKEPLRDEILNRLANYYNCKTSELI